jgi:hypothetical protein
MKFLRFFFFLLFISTIGFSQNKKYFGEYKAADAPFSINVFEKNGKLYSEAGGQGTSELVPADKEDTYEIKEVDGATMRFNKENGIVKSMTVFINDMEMNSLRTFPDLSDFEGTYEFKDAPIEGGMTIKKQGDKLQVSTPDFGTSDLKFEGVINEFIEPQFGGIFSFDRDPQGKVTKLSIGIPDQGMSIEAIKKK